MRLDSYFSVAFCSYYIDIMADSVFLDMLESLIKGLVIFLILDEVMLISYEHLICNQNAYLREK